MIDLNYKEQVEIMAKETILVVDDEAAIRLAIQAGFMGEGIDVDEAEDGEEALKMLEKKNYSLVILDVMMPNVSGYTVLQKMRTSGDHTPVLMLSGKSDEVDQVLGLGFGADSYLTKPFRISVLIQNAKALIRRTHEYSIQVQEIRRGPFVADTLRMECFKNGQELNLTGRELTMFRFFMEHPGQVFTKEQLYQHVWNEAAVDDNTIMVYIKRIRDKIEDDPKNPVYLRTIRGLGYRFDGD